MTKGKNSNKGKFLVIGIVAIMFILVGAGIQINQTGFLIGGQPVLALSNEQGKEITPDRVTVDGKTLEAKSKVTLSDLEVGEHDVVIVLRGVEYGQKINFDGKSVSLTVEEPIETSVFVVSSSNQAPQSGVSVYSDASFKCTTDNKGVCTFFEKPGKHSVKLQGSNYLKEELRTVAKDSNSFTFYTDEKVSVTAKVLDKETNQPVKDATIEVDGIVKGSTNYNGELTIPDLKLSQHSFSVSYKGLSEKNVFDVNQNGQVIPLYMVTPKTITITVKDELDNTLLEDVDVYLQGEWKGKTNTQGKLEIKDVSNKDYSLNVKYKGADKTEVITVNQFQKEFTVLLKAPKSVIFTLTDTETNKPITFENVFLESTGSAAYSSTRETDDIGKVKIDDIFPGDYRVTLQAVESRVKPSKVINIGSSKEIVVSLDMPNPELIASGLSCTEWWATITDWHGKCSVTIKNTESERSIATKDTAVVILVYLEDDSGNAQLVNKDVINIGRLLPSQEKKVTTKELTGFQWGKKEKIVAVLVEGWKYVPEDQKLMGEVNMPVSVTERWLKDLGDALVDYCTGDIVQCGKTIADVIGIIF